MKPNYEQLSFSDCMGPSLRHWSECCIEGNRLKYLDGEVEDFSGIRLFDSQDRLFAINKQIRERMKSENNF